MRNPILVGWIIFQPLFWAFFSTSAFSLSRFSISATDQKPRVVVQLSQPGPSKSGSIELYFKLLDTKTETPLSDSDLRAIHTYKLSLFVFDAGLNEYRFVFPDFTDGQWHAVLDLPVNGKYFVWAQAVLNNDGFSFLSDSSIQVIEGQVANPVPTQLGDHRTGNEGISVVILESGAVSQGRPTSLQLQFSRIDGSRPVLTPNRGALADVVGTLVDGGQIFHIHPVDSGLPNQLTLRAVFPVRGDYRLWVQFIDRGQSRTVPLSVQVQN